MVLAVARAREVEAFASVSDQLPVENRNQRAASRSILPLTCPQRNFAAERGKPTHYIRRPAVPLAQAVGRSRKR